MKLSFLLLFCHMVGVFTNQGIYKSGTAIDNKKLHNMVNDDSKLWPNGEVFYTLGDKFSEKERKRIRSAMDLIQYKTDNCIKFLPRNDQTKFVHILRGLGCESEPGMQPNGQDVRLEIGKSFSILNTLLWSLARDSRMFRGLCS